MKSQALYKVDITLNSRDAVSTIESGLRKPCGVAVHDSEATTLPGTAASPVRNEELRVVALS